VLGVFTDGDLRRTLDGQLDDDDFTYIGFMVAGDAT
jgi:hypothetical protein